MADNQNKYEKFSNEFKAYIKKFSEQKEKNKKLNNEITIDELTHPKHVDNAIQTLESIYSNKKEEQEKIINFIKDDILLPMKLFSFEDKKKFIEFIFKKLKDEQHKKDFIGKILNDITDKNKKNIFEEKDDYKFYEYLFLKFLFFNGILENLDNKNTEFNIEIKICSIKIFNSEYFKKFFNIFLKQINSEVIKEMCYLLYQIYNFNYEPKPKKNYVDELIERLILYIKNYNNNIPCMKLLEYIIEQKEKYHVTNIKSHWNLCKKSLVRISFLEDEKEKEEKKDKAKDNNNYLYFYENSTVIEILNAVREKFGKKNLYEFICGDNIIEEKDYNKTINDISKEKKSLKIRQKQYEQLMKNGKLTEKFENILKNIFNSYCNNERIMDKDCIHKFISNAINIKMNKTDMRIYSLLKYVKREIIEEKLFLSYYLNKINDGKENIVWENMYNLGFNSNLEKIKDIEILEKEKNIRYYLSNKIKEEKPFINELKEKNKETKDINLMNFILLFATNNELYNNMINNDFTNDEYKFTSNPKNYIDNIYNLIIIESIMEDIELNEMKKKEENKDKIYFEKYLPFDANENIEKKENFFINFIKNGYNDLIEYISLLLKDINENGIKEMEILQIICLKGLEIINNIYGTYYNLEKKNENFLKIQSPNYLILNNKLDENIIKLETYKDIIEQLIIFLNKNVKYESSDKNENIVNNLISNCFNLLFYLIYTRYEAFEYINNDEKIKTIFNQIIFLILSNNKNLAFQLVLLTNKVKSKSISNKYISFSIDLIFGLIKNNEFDKLDKVFTNAISYIYAVIKYDFDNKLNITKEHLNQIRLNINNLINLIDINNINDKNTINFINIIKVLRKICPLNLKELKEEIINIKINNEKTLNEFVLELLLFLEKNKLKFNKIKFEKIKALLESPENKYISYNELINNIKNEENDDIDMIKENPFIKELYEFYNWSISGTTNKDEKMKSMINIFNGMKKLEDENINVINSILNNQNKSKVLRKKYGKYVGMTNLGTTCYLNSIMQLLYMIPEFRFSILSINDGKDKIKGEYLDDDNTLHQMQKLFINLLFNSDYSIVPKDFILSLKDSNNVVFQPNNQKDSQEFYLYICEKLESILKPIPNFQFLIKNLFTGKICNSYKCEKCNNITKNYEEFKSLTLKVQNIKNLEESLDKYISKEKIKDYNCEKCNKKVTVNKNILISQLPNYLVIHLERIIKNYQTNKEIKINGRFEFPLKLNIQKYLDINDNKDIDCEYILKGINVHKGTAEGGHFVSIIKEENKWYEFDDKIIRDFNINNLDEECFGGEEKYKTAHLLFYEKVKKQLIIKVLNEDDIKEKQNIIEKNLEENNEVNDMNNIYIDQKEKFYYKFEKWNSEFMKIIPKEYLLDIFNNSKIYFKLLANNCIHTLDNYFIKIIFKVFEDKLFNIKDYNNNTYENLLVILLNTILSYYYRDTNDNKNNNNEEKEKEIIFIIQKIIMPIIDQVKKDEKNNSKILEIINDTLFNKENIIVLFYEDSVLNEEVTKQMYLLLTEITKLNQKESNKKLFKNINNIINNTKEIKEISFYIYQIIFDFFKNKLVDKINAEDTKNIFMPLFYKLTNEKKENNIKNVSNILLYLITEVNILTPEDIGELKQVFNMQLVITLFNLNLDFLIVLTKKLQYNDIKFSNNFNINSIIKLYTYCEKMQTKEKRIKYKLIKYILSLLEIVDKYTLYRMEILLGYPTLVFKDFNIYGIHLMNNDIKAEIFEYISYNHIKKERCVLAHLFPSKYNENNNLFLDEQDRLDLIYELISICLGINKSKKGNYFLFKYLYLMQSRCIYYENLYEEMKIILENANKNNQNKKYDISLIKSREIRCIEIVNYEKENLEYMITMSSGVSSTIDLKQKKYKTRPDLPESFGACKEFLNEKFNIDYYGQIVNIVPYQINKIIITLVASNDNISIFRFEYFTDYFTKKELLTFHDEKKEFSFDFIRRDKSNEFGDRGDYHEIPLKDFSKKVKDFNNFLRDIDNKLKEKEGVEIPNMLDNEDNVKKTMIRYFVLSKKKNNVLKIGNKMYELSKDIEKNFYLPDLVYDCVEKDKDKNIINIHRIKHNFKFLDINHLGIVLSNINYDNYFKENFN